MTGLARVALYVCCAASVTTLTVSTSAPGKVLKYSNSIVVIAAGLAQSRVIVDVVLVVRGVRLTVCRRRFLVLMMLFVVVGMIR